MYSPKIKIEKEVVHVFSECNPYIEQDNAWKKLRRVSKKVTQGNMSRKEPNEVRTSSRQALIKYIV